MVELTFYDYWLVLYRRKKIILLILISSLFFSWFISNALPLVYEGKALFYIIKNNGSPSVLGSRGEKLFRELPEPEVNGDMLDVFIGILTSNHLKTMVAEGFPGKKVSDLSRDVDIQLGSDNMIEVYVRDKTPDLAADIANAYIKHFDSVLQEYSSNSLKQVKLATTNKLDEVRIKLVDVKQNLQDFRQEKKIVSWDDETKGLISTKIDFQVALKKKSIKSNEIKKQIESIKNQLEKEAKIHLSSEMVTENTLIDELKKKQYDLKMKLAGFKKDLTKFHPKVVILETELEELQEDLKNEIQLILTSKIQPLNTLHEKLRQDLVSLFVTKETLAVEKSSLKKTIANIEKDMSEFPHIDMQLKELNGKVLYYSAMRNSLLLRLEEVDIQQRRSMQSIVVVDWAVPPDTVVFPVIWLNMLVSGILGLTVGCFYCFLLDYIARIRMLNRVPEDEGEVMTNVAKQGL